MATYPALIPPTDAARLAALRAYQLLGNAPGDSLLDQVVELVALLFEVPIALISLVDQHRVAFKANYGLAGVHEVPRNDSLCAVAVLATDTTVFENLHVSPCQLTNPQAARQHAFGFYAGHPLTTPWGQNIGVLCLLDRQPRQLPPPARQRLATLAHLVRQLFDLRALRRQQPDPAAEARWQLLQGSLQQARARLLLLRARGAEAAEAEPAWCYRQAVDAEAERVIQALHTQLAQAGQQLG